MDVKHHVYLLYQSLIVLGRKEKFLYSYPSELPYSCAVFGLIIIRYLTSQKVVIKNKCWHHMLLTCVGDQWLIESQWHHMILTCVDDQWLIESRWHHMLLTCVDDQWLIESRWHHMLLTCVGDQWLTESRLGTTLFVWSVGQVFTTHDNDGRVLLLI